ncbi:MAG: DNA polymerase III subunit gamma/tau [Candidatus Omnitrophica bacterium]|nr:DNA polymerase III subunit gamma/tau [Candidatus Omnitrophota bacterium]
MSYIVLARKYRPQKFDEIIGQSHITTTLKNAISYDRVAHAYLFTGSRGIGKTTTARILAKALNCEKGPTAEPCNACASCAGINQGTSLDVLEIDGASNRGIDEIRNLRDNVKFAPARGRYKVYIIDEVHMLTPEAFNALLKTLEEPPPHVKFIFATTQAHKVPATILSRCQRFDFRRIATKDIIQSLRQIVRNEKIDIKDDALILISRYADGSMRDAEVILDQVVSFAHCAVGAEEVAQVLGIVDEEVLFGLSDAVAKKDPGRALKVVDRLVNEGKDIGHVIAHLIEHFRNIAMMKIGKDAQTLVDAGGETLKRYEGEAAKFTVEEILYVIYTLSGTIDFIRKSNMARIPFEAALVKLTKAGSIVSLEEILRRIDKLEAPAAPACQPAHTSQADRSVKASSHQAAISAEQPRTESVSTAPPSTVPSAQPASGVAGEVADKWDDILKRISTKKMSVASYLQEGVPISVESDTVVIGFPKSCKFHKEAIDSPESRKVIEEALRFEVGRDLRVKLVLTDAISGKNGSENGGGEGAGLAGQAAGKKGQGREVDPLIKSALEMFGGEIAKTFDKPACPTSTDRPAGRESA